MNRSPRTARAVWAQRIKLLLTPHNQRPNCFNNPPFFLFVAFFCPHRAPAAAAHVHHPCHIHSHSNVNEV